MIQICSDSSGICLPLSLNNRQGDVRDPGDRTDLLFVARVAPGFIDFTLANDYTHTLHNIFKQKVSIRNDRSFGPSGLTHHTTYLYGVIGISARVGDYG